MHATTSLTSLCNDLAAISREGDFAEAFLPRLASLFGLTHVSVFRGDAAGLRSTCAPNVADLVPTYAARYMKDDLLHAAKTRLAETVVVPTRTVNWRLFHRSPAYQDFYRPNDFQHLAVVRLGDGAGLVLTRGRRQGDFEDTQLLFLSRLQSVLATTFLRLSLQQTNARTLGVLSALVASQQHGAFLLLDADGRFLHRSENLANEVEALTSEQLAPLSVAAKSLCAGEARPEHLSLLIAGRRVSLQRVERKEGPLVVATFLAEAPAARVVQWAQRNALTPAETRVLCHLAQGGSNAEIAKRLFLSPATVRTHLLAIYKKLGVHRRIDAIVALQNDLR